MSHATGHALIRAAGGRVSTLSGRDAKIDDLERIATNGRIHDELLGHVNAVT